jgi:hypothetical protein
MTPAEFDQVLNRRLADARARLARKAKEYAVGDRLSNFKRAAEFQHVPATQVCWNFAMKHLVSIQDLVESGEAHPEEVWEEKIGDYVAYGILLDALVHDLRLVIPKPQALNPFVWLQREDGTWNNATTNSTDAS